MNSDRELLELAAKAAGYDYRVETCGDDYQVLVNGCLWGPLTDDGDALRLAVRLRLNLSMHHSGLKVFHDDRPWIKAGGWRSRPDENEVARRAIVRAAAQMGLQIDAATSAADSR